LVYSPSKPPVVFRKTLSTCAYDFCSPDNTYSFTENKNKTFYSNYLDYTVNDKYRDFYKFVVGFIFPNKISYFCRDGNPTSFYVKLPYPVTRQHTTILVKSVHLLRCYNCVVSYDLPFYQHENYFYFKVFMSTVHDDSKPDFMRSDVDNLCYNLPVRCDDVDSDLDSRCFAMQFVNKLLIRWHIGILWRHYCFKSYFSLSSTILDTFKQTNYYFSLACPICFSSRFASGNYSNYDLRVINAHYYYSHFNMHGNQSICNEYDINCSCSNILKSKCIIRSIDDPSFVSGILLPAHYDAKPIYYPINNDTSLIFGTAIDMVCGKGPHTFVLDDKTNTVKKKGSTNKKRTKEARAERQRCRDLMLDVHGTLKLS